MRPWIAKFFCTKCNFRWEVHGITNLDAFFRKRKWFCPYCGVEEEAFNREPGSDGRR